LEHFLRKLDGEPTDTSKEINNWIKGNILVNTTLNPFTPVWETMTGIDSLTNRSIIPQREQKLKPIDQQDIYTSTPAKAIAKGFDAVGLGNTKMASPRMVDNLIDGYFPVAGGNTSNAVDNALAKLGLKEDKNLPKGADENLVNRVLTQFEVKSDNHYSDYINNLFEMQKQLQALGGKDGEKSGLYGEVNQAIKDVLDISAEIRDIDNSKYYVQEDGTKIEMTPEEKAKRRTPLIKERNKIARFFKPYYEEVSNQYKNR
jgi:hypothetical protein